MGHGRVPLPGAYQLCLQARGGTPSYFLNTLSKYQAVQSTVSAMWIMESLVVLSNCLERVSKIPEHAISASFPQNCVVKP